MIDKKMRIAIDFDDCISNTIEVDFATCFMYNKKLNPKDNKIYRANWHNAPTIFGFTKEQDDEFYKWQRKEVVKNGWITPKFYVKEVIDFLLSQGHEIIILTSRGDQYWGDAEKETRNWLDKYEIGYVSIVANCQDKGKFCKINNIDVLIEDNQIQASRANDVEVYTIMMLQEFNKDYSNKLNKFASCWPEVPYKIFEIIDQKNFEDISQK